jgi:membrane-associated protease RseP (regulator of RpoE activity)
MRHVLGLAIIATLVACKRREAPPIAPDPAPSVGPRVAASVSAEPIVDREERVLVRRGGGRFEFDGAVYDSGDLVRSARLVPIKRGAAEGFRIDGLRKGSAVERLGFREGDLLVGVDGRLGLAPDRVLEVTEGLETAPSLEIIVERDARRSTLRYVLEAPRK